jgi:hypothetical protein
MMFGALSSSEIFLSAATSLSNHRAARIWFQFVEKVTGNHIDE